MADPREEHRVHVEFFHDAKEDRRASAEAGRPIFKDVEMVKIRFPGDNKRVHVAPAHEKFMMSPDKSVPGHITYAERYPQQYEAFKRQGASGITGTPISMLPGLTPSKIRELEAVNVRTVEALAALPDRNIKKMGMGARALVESAQEFLKTADKGAAAEQLRQENAALMKRMAELEALVRGQSPKPQQTDDPETWDVERLRDFLTERGASPRANASKDKMVEAVKTFLMDEAA